MEGVIENGNLGNILAENVNTCVDALNMSGVVERSEVAKAFDALDNFVCNKNAFVEERAALNDSVTDCGNFTQAVDNLCIAFGKNFLNLKESLCVIFEFNFIIELASVCGGAADFAVNADSFAVALGNHGFGVHIKKLIFEG